MKAESTVLSPESPVRGAKLATQDSPAMVFFERAREIAEFCVARGGQAFERWPVPTVFQYVFFAVVDRCVFVARERGAIAGVLFAWGRSEAEIREAAAGGRSAFNWRTSAEKSDSLFLAEVIGRRDLLPRLVKLGAARWPDWRRRKIFTFRRGELVELKPDVIAKMLSAEAEGKRGKGEKETMTHGR